MTSHPRDREIILWLAAIAAFIVVTGKIAFMAYVAVMGLI